MPDATLARHVAPTPAADRDVPLLEAIADELGAESWEGTAQALLDGLAGLLPPEALPGNAQALAARLRRFEARGRLAAAGLAATFRKGGAGVRLIRLRRIAPRPEA
jgi:hypothetical protein